MIERVRTREGETAAQQLARAALAAISEPREAATHAAEGS
jgi:hypothetical protein